MTGKLLLLLLGATLAAGCAPTYFVDEKLDRKDSARIRNTLKNDYTANTQFTTLQQVDGKVVPVRHDFHFVKAGSHQITARCFYRVTSFKSYHRVETITADLVKGRTYMLYPKVIPETEQSKTTCNVGIKDITTK